jgi:serine/threonine-protein kinase
VSTVGSESEAGSTDALAIVARDEPLRPGVVVLGKYRIDGRLGSGGMAAGAKVAARLLREAQVSASLDPDRVVRVFDVGTLEDGTPIIVLERLDGESLADALARDGAMPTDVALRWVRDACEGLAEAHQKGIVHRDIKPSNLFLENRREGQRRLRILDFGIARIRASQGHDEVDASSLTDSHGTIGSPPYMSPEQLKNSATADARADVWALGVTLFELLTGRRPFRGSGTSIVASIVADPPPTFASLGLEIDPAVEEIVSRCLNKSAEQRPQDAAELATLLNRALDACSDPGALAQTSATAAPRSPGGWLVASAGALMVVVVLSVALARSRANSEPATTPRDVASSPATVVATVATDVAPIPVVDQRVSQNIDAATGPSGAATAPAPIPSAPSAPATQGNVARGVAVSKGAATSKPAVSAAHTASILDDREF